ERLRLILDRFDLEPDHGELVDDRVERSVRVEVLAQPGEGELHLELQLALDLTDSGHKQSGEELSVTRRQGPYRGDTFPGAFDEFKRIFPHWRIFRVVVRLVPFALQQDECPADIEDRGATFR